MTLFKSKMYFSLLTPFFSIKKHCPQDSRGGGGKKPQQPPLFTPFAAGVMDDLSDDSKMKNQN